MYADVPPRGTTFTITAMTTTDTAMVIPRQDR